jgi:hypothetical protein
MRRFPSFSLDSARPAAVSVFFRAFESVLDPEAFSTLMGTLAKQPSPFAVRPGAMARCGVGGRTHQGACPEPSRAAARVFRNSWLLIIDELSWLPFEPNAAPLFFQLLS